MQKGYLIRIIPIVWFKMAKNVLSILYKLKNSKITMFFIRKWIVLYYSHIKSNFDMIFTHLFIAKDDKKFCTLHTQKQQKITMIFNDNQCTLHTRFQKFPNVPIKRTVQSENQSPETLNVLCL